MAVPVSRANVVASLVPFFNRRFELYGRQLHPIPRNVPASDPAGQRAAARATYEQDEAFAATVLCDNCYTYLYELARLEITGVHWDPWLPETDAASHPFTWLYPIGYDRLFATAGNWYCARFAGRNAVHAGDPLLQRSSRKPGIILTESDWAGTSPEPLNTALAACGDHTEVVVRDTGDKKDGTYYARFMENAIVQMKTSGVTTVACLCHHFNLGLAMKAATNQGYFPEWLATEYLGNDGMFYKRPFGTPDQLKSLMLLLSTPMHRPYPDHPSNWALQDTGNAGYPTNASDQWVQDVLYRTLLLLASGFQMAGPILTPKTFERALHQTRFPNPQHRIMAGAVGFNNGDHSMADDVAEIWWSNTAQSPYGDGPGTFCYVDGGARRRMGTFPTDDPFFKGECDNGTG